MKKSKKHVLATLWNFASLIIMAFTSAASVPRSQATPNHTPTQIVKAMPSLTLKPLNNVKPASSKMVRVASARGISS